MTDIRIEETLEAQKNHTLSFTHYIHLSLNQSGLSGEYCVIICNGDEIEEV